MKKHCFINGELVEVSQGSVSVFDHGFTVGDGVFETLKISNGQPFALTRHLDRLARSAQIIGLPDPDRLQMRNEIAMLLSADSGVLGARARLRITFTAGVGPLGSDRLADQSTRVIMWDELAPSAPTAKLAISPWPRPTRAAATGAKTTSYVENVLALRLARESKCTESLLLNDQGLVCEGTGSNIFAVTNGVIFTPPLSDGCLAGVTRQLVIDWFDAAEESMTLAELTKADELFLTSTTRDIQPVSQIQDHHVWAVGPVTKRLVDEFITRAGADPDP
jgi:branched-chain amino acid aminotransferase